MSCKHNFAYSPRTHHIENYIHCVSRWKFRDGEYPESSVANWFFVIHFFLKIVSLLEARQTGSWNKKMTRYSERNNLQTTKNAHNYESYGSHCCLRLRAVSRLVDLYSIIFFRSEWAFASHRSWASSRAEFGLGSRTRCGWYVRSVRWICAWHVYTHLRSCDLL